MRDNNKFNFPFTRQVATAIVPSSQAAAEILNKLNKEMYTKIRKVEPLKSATQQQIEKLP